MYTPSRKTYLSVAAFFMGIFCNIAAQPATISVTTPNGRNVTVTALTDNIFKVTNTAATEKIADTGNILTPDEKVNAKVSDGTITTATGLTAKVFADGSLVMSIAGNPATTIADYGTRTIAKGKQELKLYTTTPGSFYGAGERGHSLNLRGDTLTMYNRQNYGYTKGDPRISQMNITMPLVVSSDGFALLFDDFAPSKLILNSPIEYITENTAPVTYYYVSGADASGVATPAEATTQLTKLTGRQPLPPLWSLGYITSKYGYHDQAETMGVVDTLKRKGYPLDGIVLDLYWYGKEQDMGRLEWEPSQWPNPKKMLADLKKKGVNMIIISQPYVLRNGRAIDNYNFFADKNMLVMDSVGKNPQEVTIWVGEGGMFDVSNPDTRAWLAQRYKDLTDMGVTGWWGDLGEPEVHPETGTHANGLTARMYHNKYGNDWSSIISEMFAKEYPDTRLLTMMRGGTIGLQRYSVFPWSTDVSRSWGGMQPQVTIMLNSGLSGLGYMGHDVGGFAVDPAHPEDAELYVRWLQLGTFSPMLRTHAQHMAEPYKYPQFASIIEPLIKERYRWLPYNYTLAWENASKGWPLVRPLNFYESGNNAYDNIDDEYLWGSEVLVAPVMQQGAVKRDVTFPEFSSWVDINNPANVYEGGTTISDYDAPLSVLPMFVRAGAFIPTADYKMESTLNYKPGQYTINYYPVNGISSQYTMYEDDLKSPKALADGAYRLIHFEGADNNDGIEISVDVEGQYPGAPKAYSLNFVVYNIDRPATVAVDGKRTSFKYNAAKRTASIPVSVAPGVSKKITIK